MGDIAGADMKDVPTMQKEVSHNGKNHDIIREGLAEILNPQKAPEAIGDTGDCKPKSAHENEGARQSVFYNPVQRYNRDLSVLAIRAFTEDLAAVRYARQRQRDQNSGGGEKRGKKRKRRVDHEATNKKKVEEESSTLADETTKTGPRGPTGTRPEKPREDHGNMFISADREVVHTAVEEPEENTEDERKQHDEEKCVEEYFETPPEDKAGEQVPLDVQVDALDPPKGPKNKKPLYPAQSLRILDALSATGLRALRYAKEIPLVTSIIANDLSSSATASIKLNVAHNALLSKITISTSDALEHMYSTMSRAHGRMPQSYHVIDLDPYGTAAPFLDAAVQAITDGGLLCVTCTDAGVFASVGYLEKTFSQYGGLPLKGPHAHEAGLRLILYAIATTAARYGIAIEPLLSLSIDFYARVFVRVHKSPSEVKFLASKTMAVYQCDSGCGSWSTQFLAQAKGKEARNGDIFYKFTSALGPSAGRECEHCGFRTHLAGPMWGGALHNPYFVQRILDMLPGLDNKVYQTIPRIEGMLSLALDESLENPWASTADSKKQSMSNETRKEGSSTAAIEGASITNGKQSPLSTATPTTAPSRPIPPLPAHYRITHPFFIHPPTLARALNTPTPSDASLRGALHHLGYHTSRSHTKAGSIITDTPFNVIWEVMREWARKESKNGKGPKITPNTAGAGIMRHDRSRRDVQAARKEVDGKIAGVESVEELKRELEAALYRLTNQTATTNDTTAQSKTQFTDTTTSPPLGKMPTNFPLLAPDPELHKLDIRFDEKLGKDSDPGPGKKRLVRYQGNPRENWGPMGRAKG